MTVWKDVIVPALRWRLTLNWEFGSPGASLAHSETRYRDPLNITLVTLKLGPSKAAIRPVVSKLRFPLFASAVVTVRTSLPIRGAHPSLAPVSKSLAAPVVFGGDPGGGATNVMLKLSR